MFKNNTTNGTAATDNRTAFGFGSPIGPDDRFMRGVFFSPEGEGGTPTDQQQQQQQQTSNQQQQQQETDPLASLDDAGKAALEARIAAAVAEATTKATEKVRTDTLAEVEKNRKIAERKAARDRAAADGDTAEQNRLAQEQIDADRAEAARDKEAAKKLLEDTQKIQIVAQVGLPQGYEKRLLGSNVAEWTADAKEQAKLLGVQHRTGDTEGGDRGIATSKTAQETAAKKAVGNVLRML